MNASIMIEDIVPLDDYAKRRDEYRTEVMNAKKLRYIAIGENVSLLFENRTTIRFQIQEMARAEKILSDEGIQTELDIYNPLIPEPGHLATTMFIELTTDAEMREWLPKLVGIERHIVLRLGEGDGAVDVRCTVDPDHEKQLTRDEVTAAVHYVHFALTPDQVEAFRAGPVTLVVDHPAYGYETPLHADNVAELLADLTG